MKNKILVSIIIPVYNGEKYLKKCLESINKQSYDNIEIICINDGSSDNSLDLLKKYKSKYDNIVIVNQKNSGQAISRNNGIKKARGEYITFVDQDDYIDYDYVETLIKSIDDNDILISGYKRVDENGEILYQKNPLNCEWDRYKYCSSWSKLYKSSFIKNNKIEFGNYKIGEDVYFLIQACSLTKKVKSISYAGYNNLRNLESVSNNINKKKNNNVLMPMLNDMVEKIDFSSFNLDLLLYFFLKTVIHYIYNQRKNCSLKEYKMLFNEYYLWLNNLYKKYDRKIKFVYRKDEELKVNVLINIFIFFKKIGCVGILLFLIKVFTKSTNK